MKIKDPFILAFITALCGGPIAVAAKIGLEVIPPFTLNFLRFFLAVILMLPFVLKSHDCKIANIKHFIPVGIVGALNPLLFFVGLQTTQASVTPLIYASVPSMTALYFYMFRGNKLELRQFLGIILGLLGVSLIVLLPLFDSSHTILSLEGNLLIFIAAIAFMFYGVMSKKRQNSFDASPITLAFSFALVSLIICLPFAMNEILTIEFIPKIKPQHVAAGVYAGVVGTGFFYILYQQIIKNSNELAASLITYIQPVLTIAAAALILGEKVTVPLIIGGVLSIIGAKLASK